MVQQRMCEAARVLGADLKTPAFLYDIAEIDRRIEALATALGGKILLSYKAISSPDVLARINRDPIAGVEVASREELRALTGYPTPLFLNTPAMPLDLMKSALAAKAHLVLDSFAQSEMLRGVAGAARPPAPVFVRGNTALLKRFNPQLPPIRQDHFGMGWDELLTTLRGLQAADIPIGGLHLFAGSHTFGKLAPHLAATMADVLRAIEAELGLVLGSVNLGGGLAEAWEAEPTDFAAYRSSLRGLPGDPVILHEFGRAAFSTGGAFAARILAMKDIDGRQYAVCDGGLAQAFLLAGTENGFRKLRNPVLQAHDGQARAPAPEPIRVVGSSCSRDDVIGTLSNIPAVGDLILFTDCGAYHRTYAMPNFLSLGDASVYVT